MASFPESERAQRELVGEGWVFESDYAEMSGPEWLDDVMTRWLDLDTAMAAHAGETYEPIPLKQFANCVTSLVSILSTYSLPA